MNVLGKLLKAACRQKTAAACAIAALVLSVAAPEGNAQPPNCGFTKTVQGTVHRSTMLLMGEVDGAVLDDGTVIHRPLHRSDRFSGVAVRGDQVLRDLHDGDGSRRRHSSGGSDHDQPAHERVDRERNGTGTSTTIWPWPSSRSGSAASARFPAGKPRRWSGRTLRARHGPAADEGADGRGRRGARPTTAR